MESQLTQTFIIAEAGVNHNGSLEKAKDLVKIAKDSGANAVKFQTFKADLLVTKSARKAEYQVNNTGKDNSQYQMLKELELSEDDHFVLFELANSLGIEFLSTPFDQESLYFLIHKLGLKRIKISSGDLINAPFLFEVGKFAETVILSSGMGNLAEIEEALSILTLGFLKDSSVGINRTSLMHALASEIGYAELKRRVTILHATTDYPAKFSDVNLKAMQTIQRAFGLDVGYSDHTEGIHVSVAAVAMGAKVIEKHFTADKTQEGPDHLASLEPKELKSLVDSIRDIELSLGTGMKLPAPSEAQNAEVVRKSIVAKKAIRRGERFSSENLTIKRPGTGIRPIEFWNLIGKESNQDYIEDDLI
ncbi:putative N-acetylneuraminic acid synthetase [Leptospira ryugenii]|uniref:Putative N-acetylneuraminic acid synthetase n=1 Tax=Leptospira ryugenii TaxID=1917863 RepID=A0A2P2DVY7_9LEPT|nr:N-acetylneuraminate synthase [Leptospira ryugenii]GBF48801.1 putative N-acetylneuraminic acid synthetase [Leptospira ryugenii]